MIRTAEADHPAESFAAFVQRYLGSPPPARVSASRTAAAEVNYGRWIVRCSDCPSAQMAFEVDRLFFCVECRGGGAEVVLPVRWPSPAERAAIERLLEARPPEHRHWQPGETAADLAADNAAHGVPA